MLENAVKHSISSSHINKNEQNRTKIDLNLNAKVVLYQSKKSLHLNPPTLRCD